MDPLQASFALGLEFLSHLYHDVGLKYSGINTARSALSLIIPRRGEVTFGDSYVVKQFMRGIFKLVPPKPRYTQMWDPELVLSCLAKWSPVRFLSTLQLTQKLLVLILLCTGVRGATLQGLRTDSLSLSRESAEFVVDKKHFKQNRPSWKPEPVVLKAFPQNKSLCPVHTLRCYLTRTSAVRKGTTQLFLCTVKPWGAASRATCRRWVLAVLDAAGIDTSQYGAGSTRAAATSKALVSGAPLDTILRCGGWSRASTFVKFYNRPLTKRASASLTKHVNS